MLHEKHRAIVDNTEHTSEAAQLTTTFPQEISRFKMKSILGLTPVFLSAVSAAAIEKRQVTQFDVTNFVAGCTTAGTCS